MVSIRLFFLFKPIASPKLPEVSALINYQPKIPLRVMTADGIQIGEFGKERRRAIKFEQVPRILIDAILAAEDDRFFQHQGISWLFYNSNTNS